MSDERKQDNQAGASVTAGGLKNLEEGAKASDEQTETGEETTGVETEKKADDTSSIVSTGSTGSGTEENEEEDTRVEFQIPYTFEGKEYKELDFSGISNLTIQDAVRIQKEIFSEDNPATMLLTERSSEFLRQIATRATGLPIEFFKLMPRGIWKRVKVKLFRILQSGGDNEKHIMKFKEPYTFEGKRYTELDMSGVMTLTSMDESDAENRLMREEIIALEASENYFYNCIMASKATGLPEEFFYRLPIIELTNLKSAANDFFE